MDTLTVKQLIELLENFGEPDLPVVFQCGYGDRIDTQQALEITDEIAAWTISETSYSQSGMKLDWEYEDENPRVLVLSFSEPRL